MSALVAAYLPFSRSVRAANFSPVSQIARSQRPTRLR